MVVEVGEKKRDDYTGSCAKKVGMGEGSLLLDRLEWVYLG
jgi:hypothetical protein